MAQVRLVGGAVVTCDANFAVHPAGEVAFDDTTGRLTYVGPTRGPLDDADIDTTGQVIIPGLTNAHTHSAMTPLRSYSDDHDLQTWLGQIREFEIRMSAEDAAWGLRLAIVEMLRTGTTCFADMFHWDSTLLAIAADAGIRVSAAPSTFGYEQVGYPAMSPLDGNGILDLTEQLAREFDGEDLVRVSFGPHAPYSCSADFYRDVASRAGRLGIGVHTHLSESPFEVQQSIADHGVSPIRYLADLGVFEVPVHVAHAVNLTDGDLDILTRPAVTVAHNPVSNLKLGAGIAPIPDMAAAGVRLSLGTDSVASNNTLDLFEEIKTGTLIHRGVHHSPDITLGQDFLTMATRGGSQAAGFDAGHLVAGAPADIVVLDATGSHAIPLHNPASFLTYAARGSDVREVYIAGRHVVGAGRVLSLDEDEVRARVAATAQRITAELTGA